jgi:hypothetical protein
MGLPEPDAPATSEDELGSSSLGSAPVVLRRALVIADTHGTVISVNEAALRLFGYTAQELGQGKSCR